MMMRASIPILFKVPRNFCLSFVPIFLFQGLCSCTCCCPSPSRPPYQACAWKIRQPSVGDLFISLVLNVYFARPNKSKLSTNDWWGTTMYWDAVFISYRARSLNGVQWSLYLSCTLLVVHPCNVVSDTARCHAIDSLKDRARDNYSAINSR